MQLRVLPAAQQADLTALTHWAVFASEYPEVGEKQLFFLSTRESYCLDEELTATYGSAYRRTYSTSTFGRPLPTVRVPLDEYSDEVRSRAMWPTSVPGWWHPDMQPIHRQALARRSRCHSVDEASGQWTAGELRVGRPSREWETLKAAGSSAGDLGSSECQVNDAEEIVLVRDWQKLILAHKQLPSPTNSPQMKRPVSASKGSPAKACTPQLSREAMARFGAAHDDASSGKVRKRPRSTTSATPEKEQG